MQLNEAMHHDFRIAQDAIERSHLLVAVVCFNGILIHLVDHFLLVY